MPFQVIDGSLVLDPFAGTGTTYGLHFAVITTLSAYSASTAGSLLVASAHCGGYVLGTDINWTLLHGKGYMCMQKLMDSNCINSHTVVYKFTNGSCTNLCFTWFLNLLITCLSADYSLIYTICKSRNHSYAIYGPPCRCLHDCRLCSLS